LQRGTLVNGGCVLPAATAGVPDEAFLLTGNGAVDVRITSGELPPRTSLPETETYVTGPRPHRATQRRVASSS
jgi:hypothetical protein